MRQSDISVPAGKYVIAVSGGVDSVVLLHLLHDIRGLTLTVAHFDHGIRPDSAADREFVAGLATQHGLPFVTAEGKLGTVASEAAARTARYAFLEQVQKEYGATGIITAHHQNDLLETAIINMVRGTGRRGLTSLASTSLRMRPLLPFSKSQILAYAVAHGLEWREDSTNADATYLRNYIRLQVLPKFSSSDRQQLLGLITRLQAINTSIDAATGDLVAAQASNVFSRQWLTQLPDPVSRELLAAWLRERQVGYERQTLERAVQAIRIQKNGSSVPLKSNYYLQIGRDEVRLTRV